MQLMKLLLLPIIIVDLRVSSYQNGLRVIINRLVCGLRGAGAAGHNDALESTVARLNVALIFMISLYYLRPRANRICIIIFFIVYAVKLLIYFGSWTAGCPIASKCCLGLKKLRLMLIQLLDRVV